MKERQTDCAARSLPEDLASLVAKLESDNPVARCRAARALTTFPEAAAALGNHLKCEGDAQVRVAIFDTLTRLTGPVSATCLVECLCGDDTKLCEEAIEAMRALPPERITGLIVSWLKQA